jgi:hypothetical protein
MTMGSFASLRLALAAALLALTPAHGAENPAKPAIPDFMTGGWTMINTNATDYVDPVSGPKPVTNDPRYPHIGNLQPGQKTERVADLSSPILQDWVKPQMRKYNDAVIGGDIPFVATSLCWPGGVPAQLLVPTTVYFIQKPGEVWIVWERDHWVRRVYLDRKHSLHPKPSWFGESVGHYEGNTLVVDTIGFAEHEYGFVDNYRTPHTKYLHTVERWTITGGGKGIEVSFTVEDQGAFTEAWGGRMRYRHVAKPMEEFVCAENVNNYFGQEKFPMPQAKAPDF